MNFIIPACYFILGAKQACFPIQDFIQKIFLLHFFTPLMNIGDPDRYASKPNNRTV